MRIRGNSKKELRGNSKEGVSHVRDNSRQDVRENNERTDLLFLHGVDVSYHMDVITASRAKHPSTASRTHNKNINQDVYT